MRVSEKITITDEMVKKFSELSGDKNPLHLDENYVKSTIFKKKIVQGLLLSSFFSKLIANNYPGEGSIYLKQNLNFVNPCFINDKVEVIIELIKREKNKFYLKTQIFSGNKVIIDGEALVLKK